MERVGDTKGFTHQFLAQFNVYWITIRESRRLYNQMRQECGSRRFDFWTHELFEGISGVKVRLFIYLFNEYSFKKCLSQTTPSTASSPSSYNKNTYTLVDGRSAVRLTAEQSFNYLFWACFRIRTTPFVYTRELILTSLAMPSLRLPMVPRGPKFRPSSSSSFCMYTIDRSSHSSRLCAVVVIVCRRTCECSV